MYRIKDNERRTINLGVTIPRFVIRQIDEIRDNETSRSLWLRRAAVKELERQKKQKETLLQGVKFPATHQAAEDVLAPTTTAEDRNALGGSRYNG